MMVPRWRGTRKKEPSRARRVSGISGAPLVRCRPCSTFAPWLLLLVRSSLLLKACHSRGRRRRNSRLKTRSKVNCTVARDPQQHGRASLLPAAARTRARAQRAACRRANHHHRPHRRRTRRRRHRRRARQTCSPSRCQPHCCCCCCSSRQTRTSTSRTRTRSSSCSRGCCSAPLSLLHCCQWWASAALGRPSSAALNPRPCLCRRPTCAMRYRVHDWEQSKEEHCRKSLVQTSLAICSLELLRASERGCVACA